MSLELVELAPLPGRRVMIEGELSIGRQDCDLTISSPQVSRRHARIAPAGDGAEISDLASRNGTFVNGERIADSRALAPGDELKIGDTTWEVARVDEDAAAELAARGDVPAPPPPEPPPPAAVPPPPAPVAAADSGALEENHQPSASAARRVEATLICYAVVVLTAIGVVGYLATR